MSITQPTLILVGAGPGDPELISIKGVKALNKANVVLYDSLTHPRLLNHAPEESEKIYVGKKAGSSQNSQQEINALIVQKASEHRYIVRLKGGDPFIFGRGHEELVYAQEHGLHVEVVPGISSCTSIGELQSIPLTKRGINESFWVTTGVTRNGGVSKDIEYAAQTSATVAILMGMTNLPKIVDIFKQYDCEQTPVAVIQKGSLPREKMVTGTINTIAELVEKNELTNPALILIGDVVRLHPNFNTSLHGTA